MKGPTVFLTLYSIAWVTDGLDGRIARMLKTQSDFGSKLDDIGDTLLGIVMGISIFSWIGFELFNFLPYAVPLILIRIFNIFYTKKKYGKPYVHTYGNKLSLYRFLIAHILCGGKQLHFQKSFYPLLCGNYRRHTCLSGGVYNTHHLGKIQLQEEKHLYVFAPRGRGSNGGGRQ